MTPEPRIVCAAILCADGELVFLPRPYRHSDIMLHAEKMGLEYRETEGAKHGFLAQTYFPEKLEFVGRKQAYGIAEQAGQILPSQDTDPSALYTEDLW